MAAKALSIKYKNLLIQKFVKAAKRAFGNLGIHEFWPAEAAQMEAYFNVFLSTWFFEKYKDSPKKFRQGLERLRINHIYQLLYEFVIIGLKVAKTFENYPITPREIMDFSAFISAVAREKVQGDLFCLKGTNKIFSRKKISNIVKKIKWINVNDDIRREVGRLSAAANSLDWSLYFDVYALGGMVAHGPYPYNENILIIKNYFDLNPPIRKIKNKYPELKIYLVYGPIEDLRFDVMNHFTTKENMAGKLIKFSAESGGKSLNIGQIKKIAAHYNRLAIKQTRYVNNLKPLDIITRGAEIGYYMYKDFFKHYRTDWHPPKGVHDFIKKQGLKYWNRYKLKPVLLKKTSFKIAEIFDPRSNLII